jgi:hypothetical protein
MAKFTQPGKEKFREWLRHRQLSDAPPPDMEQIRSELGWVLAEPEAETDAARGAPFPA